jgi:hypothetical protein
MNQYFKDQKKREWTRWIYQDVYLDSGCMNRMPRWKATQSFLENGLIPLAKRYGFAISTPLSIVNARLLRVIFELSKGHSVRLAKHQKDYPPQYYDLYMETMDIFVWDTVWNVWKEMEDFTNAAYGHKVQAILPSFLWNQLDLEKSPTIQDLEDDMEDEGDETKPTSKMREDPYILDALQGSTYLDRHKH